jgi:hypothetical protein
MDRYLHLQYLLHHIHVDYAGAIAEAYKVMHSRLCNLFYNAEKGQKDKQVGNILRLEKG